MESCVNKVLKNTNVWKSLANKLPSVIVIYVTLPTDIFKNLYRKERYGVIRSTMIYWLRVQQIRTLYVLRLIFSVQFLLLSRRQWTILLYMGLQYV